MASTPAKTQPATPKETKANVSINSKASKELKEKLSLKSSKPPNPWQTITEEELAKHKDVDNQDAWISIKGIVYDISAYASKHPGGVDPLKRHCGKDSTDTFNMVHSYVDFEEILDGYRIGVLKGHPNAPRKTLCSEMREKELCCFGTRYKHPNSYFKQDSIVGTYIVMFHRSGNESDWTVGVTDKQYLHVFKYLDKRKAWLSIYELPEPLLNDAISLDFKNNFENCEITLRKPLPATVWAKQTHGLREAGQFVSVHRGHSLFDAWITTKKCLTNNILLFGVELVTSARIGVPIGYHVDLHIGDLSRPYTPVCLIHDIKEPVTSKKNQGPRDESSPCILYFIIKIYAQGAFTSQLDAIPMDDGSETITLKVSTPHGYFSMNFLNDFSFMLLIGGGTGLAPLIKIIQHFTALKERMRGKRVALLYFSEKIFDLVWRKEFIELQENVPWFYFFPVLTKPSEQCNWQGLKGRIDADLVKNCLSKVNMDKRGNHKACICGPPGFNKASVDALSGIILSENIFVFD